MSESKMASPSVVGYFDDLEAARRAIARLREWGFDPSQIGCALEAVEDPEHKGLWTKVLNFLMGESPAEARFASSIAFLHLSYPQQRYLEQKLACGGALVVIFDPYRAELARCILDSCGAEAPRSDAQAEQEFHELRIKLIGKCAECVAA